MAIDDSIDSAANLSGSLMSKKKSVSESHQVFGQPKTSSQFFEQSVQELPRDEDQDEYTSDEDKRESNHEESMEHM